MTGNTINTKPRRAGLSAANPALSLVLAKDRQPLLHRERRLRATGNWGPWETADVLPGTLPGKGWTAWVIRVHKNHVFAVLERPAEGGATHLAVSSLSGVRPTFHEMQRIKNDLAGQDATAIEVYPPQHQMVDEADMFHLWVLRGKLPFGLHTDPTGAILWGLR